MAGIHILAMERMNWMYEEAYLVFWMGMSLVLAVILARQMKNIEKIWRYVYGIENFPCDKTVFC